ncbi:MAG: hypothetical protein V4555_10485 [Acidobacteriota bacterium]
MPQTKLTVADYTTFFLAGLAGIIAANLTYLALYSGSDAIFNTLHGALMPGLLGAYLYNSNGDGTITLTGLTPCIAVFLNAVTYAFAIMIPRLLWSHVARTPTRELGRIPNHSYSTTMEYRLQTRLEELI